MSHSLKKLEKSEIELTLTVAPADYEKHLQKAAQRLSERTTIKGFRKGKVPFDVVKKEVGEMAILQEALEDVIRETFYNAVTDEKLETIGMPKIDIEKIAPGNDIIYKATVGLMPKVELANLSKIEVKKEIKKVDDAKITETLDAIRGINAVETPKDGPAVGTDKLVIDMDMKLDNVPIEGGQAKDYQVYLSEDHYVRGFNKEVEGLKKGEEKEFTLDFPDTHYQKMLAGKKVQFKIKVKEVLERHLPELTDEMAKKLGQDTVEKLKETIIKNLEAEAEQKAEQKTEIEMLEKIVADSKFEPIPTVIIDSERQKMFYELKSNLERHGVEIDQYLADIKKTEKELYEEFKTQAEKRAKAALVSRQVAIEQNLKVSEEELNQEIENMREIYKNEKETLERLNDAGVRESIATAIQNKKVVKWLKEKIVKNA
ncbi:MAG: trigger factor [Candidatus Magasanikbacteria bacterium RIFOXYB1_FULL_40_15]|uniref:Trigger factor n=1 Tax=Candidatus Magasanikbacteria bacterium RIFOXYB1_FULL_40_15 TaxID=1798697 RepID=A0A1F6NDN3_9BACT|nr:MAG: trigger factor [Candidatus Magasanikbacteria bacterium RIFOXYB1_FULL_40_15]